MARLPNKTVDSAPEASKSLLRDMARVSPTGRPLNLHAQMAGAPDVFQAYVGLRRALEEHSSLERPTRVALMVAAAGALGNDYATAIVSTLAARSGWSDAQIHSITAGAHIEDEKLDSLAGVVREAAGDAGRVSDQTWDRAINAGWEDRQLAEAFAPLALMQFTVSFLNYAQTEMDAPTTADPVSR